MTYKIVRNTAGDVVAFGPNDDNYEPTVKKGETLTIEDNAPPPDTSAAQAAQAAAKKSAYKKLAALGLTADEIAAL